MKTTMNGRFIALYFVSAAFPAIFAFFLPLYYTNNGFTEAQIGILNSVVIATAVLAPIFGVIAEKKFTTKGVMIFNGFVILLASIALYFAESFEVVFILVLIYGLFRAPLAGFSDMYVSSYTEKYELNYGSFRRYLSLGYGIALFFTLPTIYFFDLNGFLIATAFLTIIFICLVYKSEDVTREQNNDAEADNVNYTEQMKQLLKNKQFILIVAFACLFFGIESLRYSYQGILLNKHISSNLLIALSSFIMVLPEILFLPLYPRLKVRFRFGGLMLIPIAASTFILLIFAFVQNGYVLAFSTALNGIMALVYYPTIIFGIRKVVPSNVMVTAMLILGSAVSIVSFFVSMFIVTPVYATLGLEPIFIVLALLSLLSLFPLYKLRELKI